MNRFLNGLGLIALAYLLFRGGEYLFYNYEDLIGLSLKVFDGICLIVLTGYLLLRLFYGEKWAWNAGINLYFGKGLIESSESLIREIKEQDIKDVTVAQVASYMIWKITRIGIFAAIIAIIPFILLFQQNRLISKQNSLFEFQNEKVIEQAEFLKEQTGLFRNQNELLTDQNVRLDTQNYRINL